MVVGLYRLWAFCYNSVHEHFSGDSAARRPLLRNLRDYTLKRFVDAEEVGEPGWEEKGAGRRREELKADKLREFEEGCLELVTEVAPRVEVETRLERLQDQLDTLPGRLRALPSSQSKALPAP